MTINDIEFILVEIPCAARDRPVRSVLVRVTTDSDAEGWGETSLPWQAAELPGRRDALLPVLAGRSVFDIEELHTLGALSVAPLRAAVEMACWDLAGRTAGLPLCHFFGGGYREHIPLAVRLPQQQAEPQAHLARELAEQGFHAQIVTASGDVRHDVQTLEAVHEAVGDRAELRFDGAAIYDMLTARDVCRELEGTGLRFFVDPLETNELHQVASLGRQTNVPLAVWRTIGGPADVPAAVRCGAASAVVVDLALVGGMMPARKCAAVADAGGVAAVLGAAPSVGIATAAMLQVAASTPAFSSGNECVYHQLHDDVLTEPLEIVDGMMAVPQGPGLGVDVDRAKVEQYQVT